MGSETHGGKIKELGRGVDCQGFSVTTKISDGSQKLPDLFQLRIQIFFSSLGLMHTGSHAV